MNEDRALKNRQKHLRDGMCVWSIKMDDGTYDCGAMREPCCIDTDSQQCPAIKGGIYEAFYKRAVPREYE